MANRMIETGQFATEHLASGSLKEVSEVFQRAAIEIDGLLPESPEKTLSLRRLWDAKNLAVMGRVIADRG